MNPHAHTINTDILFRDIIDRAERISSTANAHYINHQQGILRGMVWAYTGSDPGVIESTERLSKLIGREIVEKDGKLFISYVA